MHCTAAIFDLDGTILDTAGDLCAALNHMLQGQGLACVDVAETRRRVGNGIKNLLRQSLPEDIGDAEFAACHDGFLAYYQAHIMDETRPYPGALDMLHTLSAAGVRLGVASNKFDAGVAALCDHFFPGLFRVTVGERAGLCRKPAPDMVKHCLDACGVEASHAMFFGDSNGDIIAARAAGLQSCAVLWGYRSQAELAVDRPDHWVRAMEEIPRLVLDKQRNQQ